MELNNINVKHLTPTTIVCKIFRKANFISYIHMTDDLILNIIS
jgi:hypothetical protein